MSIVRPILSPVLRPAWPVFLTAGISAEELRLYVLGADGSIALIDTTTIAHSFVAITQTASEATFEVDDALVIGETASTVTLEFGA